MAEIFLWVWGFALGVIAGPFVGGVLRLWMRPLRCRLGMCPGTVSSSQYGIGWLCRDCGSLKHWESWGEIDNPSRWERLRR